MTSLKQQAKALVPTPAWRAASHIYHQGRQYAQGVRDHLDPRMLSSLYHLHQYKNRHVGQRCFIIGSGPSLQQTDLTLLRNEVTFGLNRIYLIFDQMGFTTSYHVVINRLVIEQCAQEIEKIACPRFVSWRANDLIKASPTLMFIKTQYTNLFFANLLHGIGEGSTVTYAAMQIAFYMGFHQVILVGVDHSFTTQGTPHTTVVSQGDDPNHFDPRYFGKGFRWQLPDLPASEQAYYNAKQHFEQHGRVILDATVGGKLQVFPKVEFTSLFG